MTIEWMLLGVGLLAGWIDSIAGGGGLITLPVYTFLLGPGPMAVGTNKINGLFGAFFALLIYWRRGHLDWKIALHFGIWVGLGSAIGSFAAPYLPVQYFQWLLIAVCPVLLWVISNKNTWTERVSTRKPAAIFLILAGILAGFYDGFLGPGGGTLMFLALFLVGKVPLLAAVSATKWVNTVSAGVALAQYQIGGFVVWNQGVMMATGMGLGALLGARMASDRAAKIIRPTLIGVVLILVVVLIFNALSLN